MLMRTIWEKSLIHLELFNLLIFTETQQLENVKVSLLFNMKISKMPNKRLENWTVLNLKKGTRFQFQQWVIFKKEMHQLVMIIFVLMVTKWHLWTVCQDKGNLIQTCRDPQFRQFHIHTLSWQICSKCKEHLLSFSKSWKRMSKKHVPHSVLLRRFLLKRIIKVMFG